MFLFYKRLQSIVIAQQGPENRTRTYSLQASMIYSDLLQARLPAMESDSSRSLHPRTTAHQQERDLASKVPTSYDTAIRVALASSTILPMS